MGHFLLWFVIPMMGHVLVKRVGIQNHNDLSLNPDHRSLGKLFKASISLSVKGNNNSTYKVVVGIKRDNVLRSASFTNLSY